MATTGLNVNLLKNYIENNEVVYMVYNGNNIDHLDINGERIWEPLTYTLLEDGTYSVKAARKDITGELIIPSSYKGAAVVSIEMGAFADCTSLTSVVIPNSVIVIDMNAFIRCTSLTSVVIPDSVRSIGRNAFYKCTSLTSVTIPDSVISISDSAFYNCTSLTDVYINDIAAWCGISFGANANPFCHASNLYLNNELVTELVIPDGVTNIKYYAFYGCTSLTSVVIPDSVTSIGMYAFSRCGIKSIVIPSSLTSINSHAFLNCSSLTDVYINDIAAWCRISFSMNDSNPFCHASNLYLNNELVTELVLPNSVESISDYAFNGCKSLTSVVIPDSVISIGQDAFIGCTALTSATFECTIWEINDTLYSFSINTKAANATALTDTYVGYTWTKCVLTAPSIAATVTKNSGYDSVSTTLTNPNSVELPYYIHYEYTTTDLSNRTSRDNSGTIAANGTVTHKVIPSKQGDGVDIDTTFETCSITAYWVDYRSSNYTSITVDGSEYSEAAETTA